MFILAFYYFYYFVVLKEGIVCAKYHSHSRWE